MAGMTSPKPLQIFKPGRHTAMSGAVLEFSAADLAATAAAYDPARHEAPIVVGHPRLDAPAYGWVKGLSASNGLEAEPHQVDPAFAEMVDAGRFKKISASFFAPDSPQNPVPGCYYLRHVGFLGAQPPAVKGLRAPEFGEGEEGIVEFSDWSDVQNASLWRRMREFIIAQFGLEKADSVVPDYAVATLETEARTESNDEAATRTTAAPAFSTPLDQQGDDMSAEDKARLEALEAENKRLKDEATARVRQTRHAENVAFCDGLVTGGKLSPGNRDIALASLDHFSNASEPVEFGEGESKKPMLDAFREFLTGMPKAIEFGEVSADKTAVTGGVSFAAPPGYSVDAAALEILAKAQAYAAAHNVTVDQALSRVR